MKVYIVQSYSDNGSCLINIFSNIDKAKDKLSQLYNKYNKNKTQYCSWDDNSKTKFSQMYQDYCEAIYYIKEENVL